jgi:hypothetical protein
MINKDRGYYLPSLCPLPNTPLSYVQERHQAPLLVQTLEAFLHATFPMTRQPIRVRSFDRIDVFKYITILARSHQHINDTKRLFKIRVSPESPARDARKKPTPAIFDTALIIEDLEQFTGTGVTGENLVRGASNNSSWLTIIARHASGANQGHIQAPSFQFPGQDEAPAGLHSLVSPSSKFR